MEVPGVALAKPARRARDFEGRCLLPVRTGAMAFNGGSTEQRLTPRLKQKTNDIKKRKIVMKIPSVKILSVVVAAAALIFSLPVFSQALKPEEGAAIAEEAYVYGYPLITMEMTRRVMTNVREVEGSRAPMGHLNRMRAYPTAAFRDVTAPNADTLYTTAWIDVGKEPWILSLPDAHDRYYLFPMLDGWTDVFQVPGKRTTGTGAQTYAITGPDKESNWLPAPSGKFITMLRLYWPTETPPSIIDGTWKIPAVQIVN